jgi:replicative DNA helicase
VTAAARMDAMPPEADSIEQQLLGSLMVDPSRLDAVGRIIGRDDFRTDRHRYLFDHIYNAPAEVVADVSLLTRWLMGAGDLEEIGGAPYLAEVAHSVVNSANAPAYAGIIRDTAIRRRLREKGLLLAAMAEDPRSDLDAVVGRATEVVEAARATPRVNGHNGVVSRTFDQIKVQKLQWLWPGKIPLGKYTELVGYPGVGKSLLTVDLMARVSRGFACPDSNTIMGPGGVVLMTAEDDAGAARLGAHQ